MSDAVVKFPNANPNSLKSTIAFHCTYISRQGMEILCRDLCVKKTFPNAERELRFITFLSWLLYPRYQLPFYPTAAENIVFRMVNILVY